MSDNRWMEERAEHRPRLQFRVRHLLLLTAATAVELGIVRWIYSLKLWASQYTPLVIWGSCGLTLLTAMGWMLLNAGRRFEISWQRIVTLLIGLGPVGFWLSGFALIAQRPVKGEAPQLAQYALQAGVTAAALSCIAAILAIIVNLWRDTDRLLLAVQLLILTLAIVGFGAAVELRIPK